MEQTFLAVINCSSLLDKEIKVNFVSRGMNDFLKLHFLCKKSKGLHWNMNPWRNVYYIMILDGLLGIHYICQTSIHTKRAQWTKSFFKDKFCCIFYLYICCYVVGVLVGLHADGNNFHNLHGNLHQVLCRPHSILQSQEASSSPVLRDPSQTNYHSAKNGLYPLTVL